MGWYGTIQQWQTPQKKKTRTGAQKLFMGNVIILGNSCACTLVDVSHASGPKSSSISIVNAKKTTFS